MRKTFPYCFTALLVFGLLVPATAFAQHFKAGYAKRDVTPTDAMPMWGYGARHDALSKGVRDPLYAKAVVIDVGEDKLAIVGLDLGRSPDKESMAKIREAVRKDSGVNYLLISGSHTHHGPVLELKDEPGKGGEKYPYAVQYVTELEGKLIDCINEAASKVEDARIGWGSKDVYMNRNRHTEIKPKPVDTELSVIRIDDASGEPVAVIVNYAAHPTNLPTMDLRYSAEYPGAMMNEVERAMDTNCVFMQGAAGDMSCSKTEETQTIDAFGKALAEHVIEVAKTVETTAPESPKIQGKDEEFEFTPRIDFSNKFILKLFQDAFFPELANAAIDSYAGNTIRPHLTTVLLNDTLALVGGSGEFFCNHAIRLKERSRVKTIFFGYCNGHHMYFPTIEAAAEGGYGADATVSWVPIGAGELMMNTALENIYRFQGAFKLSFSDI